jgi:ABC-type multidrug transport system permease subunit
MRRRLLVVGAGFVCGGVFVSLLALAIGSTPDGEEVMWAGMIGGALPVVIGIGLMVAALFVRR